MQEVETSQEEVAVLVLEVQTLQTLQIAALNLQLKLIVDLDSSKFIADFVLT